jgi:hypothetical protein
MGRQNKAESADVLDDAKVRPHVKYFSKAKRYAYSSWSMI